MSDSPIERENLTAALVRDYDDEALVEWIHALQDREEELEARVAELEREAKQNWDTLQYAKGQSADLYDENVALEARVKKLEGVIRLGIDSVPLHWLGVARTALVREGDE